MIRMVTVIALVSFSTGSGQAQNRLSSRQRTILHKIEGTRSWYSSLPMSKSMRRSLDKLLDQAKRNAVRGNVPKLTVKSLGVKMEKTNKKAERCSRLFLSNKKDAFSALITEEIFKADGSSHLIQRTLNVLPNGRILEVKQNVPHDDGPRATYTLYNAEGKRIVKRGDASLLWGRTEFPSDYPGTDKMIRSKFGISTEALNTILTL